MELLLFNTYNKLLKALEQHLSHIQYTVSSIHSSQHTPALFTAKVGQQRDLVWIELSNRIVGCGYNPPTALPLNYTCSSESLMRIIWARETRRIEKGKKKLCALLASSPTALKSSSPHPFCTPEWVAPLLRGRLHGEFQPGLKFRTAHQAEIFLRLHGEFQPGCNVYNWGEKICNKAFYMLLSCTTDEVRMPKFIFQPGLKF